jgi:hypothetical protein
VTLYSTCVFFIAIVSSRGAMKKSYIERGNFKTPSKNVSDGRISVCRELFCMVRHIAKGVACRPPANKSSF